LKGAANREWLVRHHELVVEAARTLAARARDDLCVAFDHNLVLLGAALHDAGRPGPIPGDSPGRLARSRT
jgi:hypothetical protein